MARFTVTYKPKPDGDGWHVDMDWHADGMTLAETLEAYDKLRERIIKIYKEKGLP